jgi:uncharacterized protein YbjT (DUF2867 family)
MILITGATGRPGAATVREFARRGTPVRALVRDAGRAAELAALPGVELAVGDMLWPETLEPAFDGVDRVLMISSAGPQMLETRATFIDVAVRAGVHHLVKLAGGDNQPGFDPERFRSTRSHRQIQRYLEASGLSWTTLHPSQFMQVYLEEAADIPGAGELRLPMGDTALAPHRRRRHRPDRLRGAHHDRERGLDVPDDRPRVADHGLFELAGAATEK